MHRPKPKGGVDRAFTVPLSRFVLDLLWRRRMESDANDSWGLSRPPYSAAASSW